MKTLKPMAVVMAVASIVMVSGCGSDLDQPINAEIGGFEADALIGVSIPYICDSCGWNLDEAFFNDELYDAGFSPMVLPSDVFYEQEDIVEYMIEQGAKVIVVNPLDRAELVPLLATAKEAGVYVIAYDRLLTETPDVDLYITYDYCQIGVLQADSLLEGLAKRSDPPWNVELIAGSPDDARASMMFECAMGVLRPKIDDGVLVVPSGQVSFEAVATEGERETSVRARFAELMIEFYNKGASLNGLLSSKGTLARAAATTISEAGKSIPVFTALDSEGVGGRWSDPIVESIEWIAEGKQYSAVNRDVNTLVSETIKIIQMLQRGEEVLVHDVETYHNGVKVVPTYLLAPVLVTKDNLCTVYEAGFWTKVAASTSLCGG